LTRICAGDVSFRLYAAALKLKPIIFRPAVRRCGLFCGGRRPAPFRQ